MMQRDSFNHEPAVTRRLIECLRSCFVLATIFIVVSDSNLVCIGCSSWTVKGRHASSLCMFGGRFDEMTTYLPSRPIRSPSKRTSSTSQVSGDGRHANPIALPQVDGQ
jgi:hypothetical protein